MNRETWIGGVRRELWDNDGARKYTTWDQNGVQTFQRDYTAEENAQADADAAAETAEAEQKSNKSTIQTNLEQDYLNMQAIKAQTNADLRADPSQEIKQIADAVRRLTRMALEDYSGTD